MLLSLFLQLFGLLVFFELGSSLMIPLGTHSEQDAWIAILLSLMAGLLIFQVYLYLYRQYPAIPLTGYIRKSGSDSTCIVQIDEKPGFHVF
ncbi:GerAB/ArcD/ProY family transporter [Brevibacillus borstelensis]|uniref:GerAB/ArcD/ProY family transporter n=1 Tax=Brevibacillus borstelensis TaxID=45462 RepID=UPI0030C60320